MHISQPILPKENMYFTVNQREKISLERNLVMKNLRKPVINTLKYSQRIEKMATMTMAQLSIVNTQLMRVIHIILYPMTETENCTNNIKNWLKKSQMFYL